MFEPTKEPPLKTFPSRRLAFAALFIASATACSWGQTFTDDFDGLNAGSLSGQGGWTTRSSGVSPGVASGPAGSLDTSKAVAISASSGTAAAGTSLFSAGTVTSSSVVTISFDAYAAGGGSIEMLGIGAPGNALTAMFGIFSGNFQMRGEALGTSNNLLNGSGGSVAALQGHWYTIESVWDLSTGAASFFVKDLTAGAATFTQLYYDAAQTQATASLGLNTTPDTWTDLMIRSGNSTSGQGYLDNVRVSVVPEPMAWSLLGLGLPFLFRGRRRAAVRG